MRIILSLICIVAACSAAEEIQLASPLTTVVPLKSAPAGTATAITTTLVVPADAPVDLGVGGFMTDAEGTWWQSLCTQPLSPGRHEVTIELSSATTHGEGHAGRWSPRHGQLASQGGLFFWSEHASSATIVIEQFEVLVTNTQEQPAAEQHGLDHFAFDGMTLGEDGWQATTGERLSLRVRPHPFPAVPYDPHLFSLTAIFSADNQEDRIAGFYRQTIDLAAPNAFGGAQVNGPDGFEIRWRPRRPGIYQVKLLVAWDQQAPLTIDLPPITVEAGPPRPPVPNPTLVTPETSEHWWPLGLNAHASAERNTSTRKGLPFVPERTWQGYHDYLHQLAANDQNYTEIWLSSWTLPSAWERTGPGLHGIEAYHQVNAERLDHLLDAAHALGIRIKFIVNHGQMATVVDGDWFLNPFFARPNYVARPRPRFRDRGIDWFLDRHVQHRQLQLRRYAIARWADHPAVIGWDIATEDELTSSQRIHQTDESRFEAWQQKTLQAWRDADSYNFIFTTDANKNIYHSDDVMAVLMSNPNELFDPVSQRTSQQKPPTRTKVVKLASPLTTVVRADSVPRGDARGISAIVHVPEGAPADLGIGGYVADDDGTWWQVSRPGSLTPGRHELYFHLQEATIRGEAHAGIWSARQAELIREAGLFLWSEHAAKVPIRIERLNLDVSPFHKPPTSSRFSLDQFDVSGVTHIANEWQAPTGQRISWTVRPDPFPNDVYDPHEFRLTMTFTNGSHSERITGFYRQRMSLSDIGSHEEARRAAADGFEIRWRPRLPGRYQVKLEARWHNGEQVWSTALPTLMITGPAFQEYARVDPQDPRFFSTTGGEFIWPLGINARSVYDPRTAKNTQSHLTPDRGWHSYRSYIDRWAANGLTCAEIWLCSWSLALEWRDDWPGFHGIEAYNQMNAERLDRVLDYAWEKGIRINLVINNHGQASTQVDREWHNNPWNKNIENARGLTPGPLNNTFEWFASKRARQGQDRMRRYLISRWGDHPAVLAWKLTSEMNLTDAGKKGGNKGRRLLRDWHQDAAAQWRKLDPYNHPVTTHWSSNYKTPYPEIMSLKEIDFVAIDAYHRPRANGGETLLAQLVWDGIHDPARGLARYRKPILITEFGGSPHAAPQPQLLAEHESGPWAAFVSGYGGSPMIWWLEWVDQRNYYHTYAGLSRFLAGEDLRAKPTSPSRGVELSTNGGRRGLWCRAWNRPGRLLGYLMDQRWGFDGHAAVVRSNQVIEIGNAVRAGSLHLQWWDCDRGELIAEATLRHSGGALRLQAPPFRKHIAFKLWRKE